VAGRRALSDGGVSVPNLCGDTGDFSSRAPSNGGGSVVATVEGLSESGSDVDVSDSC
jgi:hypothetical protein